MSAERDELMRLVQSIPDNQVPHALAAVRRLLRPVEQREWPPAWFGIADGDATALGGGDHRPNR